MTRDGMYYDNDAIRRRWRGRRSRSSAMAARAMPMP